MKRGSLTILVGPTAVGKGTVVRRLRELYPNFSVSISVTTRPPRPKEVQGEHYFFVSEQDFDHLVNSNDLLEWATVHGTYRYGTPATWVKQQREMGHDVLLELDVEGARQVRKRVPECKTVFLLPPSWDELRKRLVGRGTESQQEQIRRLETAKNEIDSANEFDVTVVNHEVDSTVRELARLLNLN